MSETRISRKEIKEIARNHKCRCADEGKECCKESDDSKDCGCDGGSCDWTDE